MNDLDISVIDVIFCHLLSKGTLHNIKQPHIHNNVRYWCDQCIASYIRLHKDPIHGGVKYLYDQCDASTLSLPRSLKNHEGKINQCDQCNPTPFKYKSVLRKHKVSIHDGVRYECTKCSYKAAQKIHPQ